MPPDDFTLGTFPDVGSYGRVVMLHERMWREIYVGRCAAGDEPDVAIQRANDAVVAYQARARVREERIRANVAVYA